MIVLEALSKALMADELSELKLPSGKMHGPTPDSTGFTLRRRAELAQIETGEMVQRRNSHRSDDQSIVNEVLYIAQRAVDPSPSPVDDRHATAFAHSPLNHYGLSNIAQRSAHESADSTTDYEGWTPPEQYNGSQGIATISPSVVARQPDRHLTTTSGNTWVSAVGSSVDQQHRANLTIAVLQRAMARQIQLVPEAQETLFMKLANAYRERMTVILAARVMRKELSWATLRRDISEQRTDDLNHLMGVRIFPTVVAVRAVWEQIFIKIAHTAGVEILVGKNGEVGYWPLRKIISYFLSDADLRSCVTTPRIDNKVCIVFTLEQYRNACTHGSIEPITLTGEGAQLLDNCANMELNELNELAELDMAASMAETIDSDAGLDMSLDGDEPIAAPMEETLGAVAPSVVAVAPVVAPAVVAASSTAAAPPAAAAVTAVTAVSDGSEDTHLDNHDRDIKLLTALSYEPPTGHTLHSVIDQQLVEVEVQDGTYKRQDSKYVTVHGARKTNLTASEELTFLPLADLTIRGMIDAGAQMGKAGGGGLTVACGSYL